MIVGLVNYLGCGFQTEDTQLGMLIAYLQNGLRVQQQQQVYFTEKETPPKKNSARSLSYPVEYIHIHCHRIVHETFDGTILRLHNRPSRTNCNAQQRRCQHC